VASDPRELVAGLALGCVAGAIALVRILLMGRTKEKVYGQHYLLVAGHGGVQLIGVVLFGSLAGSMLPFLLRRLDLILPHLGPFRGDTGGRDGWLLLQYCVSDFAWNAPMKLKT